MVPVALQCCTTQQPKIYAFRNDRIEKTRFELIIQQLGVALRQDNIPLDFEITEKDPGAGQCIVVFDYWGRSGGALRKPFKDSEASFINVIVSPNALSNLPSCDWALGQTFNIVDEYGLLQGETTKLIKKLKSLSNQIVIVEPVKELKSFEVVPIESVKEIKKEGVHNSTKLYLFQSSRISTEMFSKVAEHFKKRLNCEVTTTDPGDSGCLITINYWGRSGGAVEKPFQGSKASFINVIVSPNALSSFPSCDWALGKAVNLVYANNFFENIGDVTKEIKQMINIHSEKYTEETTKVENVVLSQKLISSNELEKTSEEGIDQTEVKCSADMQGMKAELSQLKDETFDSQFQNPVEEVTEVDTLTTSVSQKSVDLCVDYDTGYGNFLLLCGEGGGLSWNSSEALCLTCHNGNQWKINIPAEVKEFKLILRKEDGSIKWEEGPNRLLENNQSVSIQNLYF